MSKNQLPDLPPAVRGKLRQYEVLLRKWQKAVNLVAPSTLDDAWNRHFQDSLQLLDLIPPNATTLVDIGSGAGFPGLVLAIARPDLAVQLVESDQKKGVFLLTVSRETGAKNVSLFNERIESVMPNLRADVVTARALAPLSDLLAMTQPQWEQGGGRAAPAVLLFLKGAGWQAEVDTAKKSFDFNVKVVPSQTARDSVTLCISGVRVRGDA